MERKLAKLGTKVDQKNVFALQQGAFDAGVYFYSATGGFPYMFSFDDNLVLFDGLEDLIKEISETEGAKYEPKYKPKIIFESFPFENFKSEEMRVNSLYARGIRYYDVLPDLIISIQGLEMKKMNNFMCNGEVLTGYKPTFSGIIINYSPNTEKFLEKIIDYITKNSISFDNKSALLGIVSYDDGDYYINYIDITHKLGQFVELDLHYGDGFSSFYDKVKELLIDNSKGLMLFHGLPGTGKTYCLRHLIKELNEKKNFLYMPSSMIEHITDPTFMSFLTNEILNSEGKEYVIIIEDAEILLTNREDSHLTNGVSNILNLTDGLLNDILSVQVIATFNTDLQNIDEALLRKGRLLARKEFVALDIDRATKLIEILGLKVTPTDSMTLSDLYSQKKSIDFITHGVKPNKKAKFGFTA